MNLLPQRSYTAEDFNIETIKSDNDYNGNGIDDYTDIVIGARIDAKNKPKYKSVYYDGGYPPDEEGVCTDVIRRAFKNAGYSLKDMVDKDIEENVELYPRVECNPDKNIDFRRVPNLKVFFDRHAISLTLDPYGIEEWQPITGHYRFELPNIKLFASEDEAKYINRTETPTKLAAL